jgi:hypothetical protein
VVFWIHGFWLETTLFLDAAARTTAGLFRMRRHRALVPWFGAAIFGLAYVVAHSELQTLEERRLLDSWGFLILGLGLPAILLVMTALRGRASGAGIPRRRRAILIR